MSTSLASPQFAFSESPEPEGFQVMPFGEQETPIEELPVRTRLAHLVDRAALNYRGDLLGQTAATFVSTFVEILEVVDSADIEAEFCNDDGPFFQRLEDLCGALFVARSDIRFWSSWEPDNIRKLWSGVCEDRRQLFRERSEAVSQQLRPTVADLNTQGVSRRQIARIYRRMNRQGNYDEAWVDGVLSGSIKLTDQDRVMNNVVARTPVELDLTRLLLRRIRKLQGS